jgi:O-antigen/teichoic acid export membrane protein
MKMIDKIIKSSLFKNTGVYTLTNIINSAIPFFLLPILTRYLSPEDYGIVSMFSLLITFTSPFVGLSVNGAIARQYYNQEETDIFSYVFNCIMILVSSTLVVGIVFLIFSEFIAQLVSFPAQFLWMVIAFCFSHGTVNIIRSLWQVQQKAFSYGVFNNMMTLSNAILSIVFVVGMGLGWKGRIYGKFGTMVVFWIIAIYIIFKNGWVKVSLNKKYIYNALMFGIPLIPHALSGSIISMTDRFFITSMVGLAATGVYTVGYQVGSIINLLASSFNNAYVPWLYERLKKNEYSINVKIVKFTYTYFVGIILIALVLGFLAPYLLKIFVGKSFNESSIYVVWVAMGYAFNGMYLMVVNYIFYVQKTKFLAMVTFATALINIVLNYFFIKEFGAVGAAQATTVVFAIKFVMVWILSARVHKMPWKEAFKNS